MPVQTVYELASAWYAGRLAEDWVPRSAAQSEEVFVAFGLEAKFWRLT